MSESSGGGGRGRGRGRGRGYWPRRQYHNRDQRPDPADTNHSSEHVVPADRGTSRNVRGRGRKPQHNQRPDAGNSQAVEDAAANDNEAAAGNNSEKDDRRRHQDDRRSDDPRQSHDDDSSTGGRSKRGRRQQPNRPKRGGNTEQQYSRQRNNNENVNHRSQSRIELRNGNSDNNDLRNNNDARSGRGRGRHHYQRNDGRESRTADIDAIIGALAVTTVANNPEHERKPPEPRARQVNVRTRVKKSKSSAVESNLRTKLTDLMFKGLAECMVCLDKVRQQHSTWDCHNCFQIFHFNCIQHWARSTTQESGWRCPGCQVVTHAVPREYRCFCRKMLRPEWYRNEGLVPHSCGEMCGRPLATAPDTDCPHKCTDLCHPGPCHPCSAIISKSCHCGATVKRVKCEVEVVCENTCDKPLSCGHHSCPDTCHPGDCAPCQLKIKQDCYCGQNSREVECSPDNYEPYQCGAVCDNVLDCGQHRCQDQCHPGECAPCELTPERVTHCPCGQTPVSPGTRTVCTDPVPVCGHQCSKLLSCGQPSSPHLCRSQCHTGPCPECPLETRVRCRCGAMHQNIPCSDLTTRADDARCQKKCQKKRMCGRHKCGEVCCIRVEHPCTQICNRLLSCKLHHCQDLCHPGNCKTCYNVSFDELRCECGASVMYPPVPCGTRPPDCSQPCSRPHSCDHPVLHTCHSDAQCPSCTTLTTKLCYCGHETRRNIPCLVEGVSCGRPCGKTLSCGQHQCPRICHPGACTDQCAQPCPAPRDCGHGCGAPCHTGPCPDVSCTAQIKVSCDCGRRQTSVSCSDTSFSKTSASLLATQMAELKAGNSVNLAELAKKNRKLECDEECFKIARNARFADALNLDNAEVTSKVIPRYSDFMKDWVKRDSALCSMVHSKLVDLVKLAKESKQKSRSFSFPVMNRDKRQFVHEYAEVFCCESQSYDAEPKRNVVVTALRDKSAVPSVSLLEVVARQKKAPTPLMDLDASHSRPTYTNLSATKSGSDNKIDWFG